MIAVVPHRNADFHMLSLHGLIRRAGVNANNLSVNARRRDRCWRRRVDGRRFNHRLRLSDDADDFTLVGVIAAYERENLAVVRREIYLMRFCRQVDWRAAGGVVHNHRV